MAHRTISAWVVRIEGHDFDLEDLPVFLHGSTIQITKRPDGYCLQIPASLAGTGHEPVLPMATEFLGLLNGAASVLIDSYRQVRIAPGAYHGIDDSGVVVHTVIQIGTAEMRCKAGHLTAVVNGVPQPDSRLGQITTFINIAKRSTAAADALSLLGRPVPTWSELFLVYELVEANSGRRMYDEDWITKADGQRFTRTANSYTALGREARHGKNTSQPPSRPMNRHEATQLMRTLVAAWIGNFAPSGESAG